MPENQNIGKFFNNFITVSRARDIAQKAVYRESKAGGPIFRAWNEASVGTPILIQTVYRRPSYWLFPIEIRGSQVGFVRVLGDGRVAHIGSFSFSKDIAEERRMITGITQEEAALKAKERIQSDRGEVPSPPFYVHDGSIGREVWLVEVSRDGVPHRWIFVSPSFVYERPYGVSLRNGME